MRLRPTPKVAAGGAGGALAVVVLWLIPGEEPSAVAAAVATLCSFGFAWLTSEQG